MKLFTFEPVLLFMKATNCVLLLFTLAMHHSCKEKVVNPPLDNEQEIVTTVRLVFSDTATGAVDSFDFKDPDGAGGNDPAIDTISLNAYSKYRCSVFFYDESDPTGIENITEEVIEEGDDHHICLENLSSAGISITFKEADNYGFPFPLNSLWKVAGPGSGTIQVLLKHKEGHSHSSCEEGETDVEVGFPVEVL